MVSDRQFEMSINVNEKMVKIYSMETTNNFYLPIDSSRQYDFNETTLHFRLPPEVIPVVVRKLKNYLGSTINIFELEFRIQFRFRIRVWGFVRLSERLEEKKI